MLVKDPKDFWSTIGDPCLRRMWHVIYHYEYVSNDMKQASSFKEMNAHKTLKV